MAKPLKEKTKKWLEARIADQKARGQVRRPTRDEERGLASNCHTQAAGGQARIAWRLPDA